MKSSNLADVLSTDPEEIDRRLADGWALPAEFYTAPEIHQLEQDRLFGRSWTIAGLEREVAAPGDFLTTTVAGVPLIVVRDDSSTLRAHINVCRHRGHPVATGRGSCRALQCRYHGWTYDLRGGLSRMPRGEEVHTELEDLGLLPAAVEVWAGVVFVSLRPKEPLERALGELPQAMADTGYTFPFASDTELTLFRHSEMRLQCNWKVAWENSLECYHCATVHAQSFAEYYNIDRTGYTIQNFDRGFYHLAYFWDEVAERFGLKDNSKPAVAWYYLFPGVTFVGGTQSRGVRMNRIVPLGPGECLYERYAYKEPGVDAGQLEELQDASSRTVEEDRDVCEAVQRGLESGAVPFGRTMPKSEAAVRHFHALLWQELAPAFQAPAVG